MQLVGERSRDEFAPVLITGGAGFLGRFLAARLDVYGAHSRVYDRAMREDDLLVYESGRVNRWVHPHVKALEANLISNGEAGSIVVRPRAST